MKKNLILGLVMVIILAACGGKNLSEKNIESEWRTEKHSDFMEGELPDDFIEYDMTLKLENGNFILTDNESGTIREGTYSLEKVGDAYKFDMKFEEENVVGVYGTREYQDGTTTETITFQLDEKILSFVPSEKP